MSSAHFGSGSGPIWLDDLGCNGNEADIDQCSKANNVWGSNNCNHGEDAGVICGKVTFYNYEVITYVGIQSRDSLNVLLTVIL